VGVGKYIFLYTTIDGKLHHRLKGHRDQIYTLSYSHDGEFLASGGMDKCTIIWTKEGKGVLKFTHESSIQLLAFNPVEVLLASCSSFDVGFWSPKNQIVKKNKIDSKILSATWKPTGDILAMGLVSGSIHFINTNGIFQKSLIMGAPVWTLLWCSAKDGYNENVANCLVIGTWDLVVTYYDHANSNILSKIDVGGFPMTLTLLDAWPCPFIIVGTTSGAMKIINDKWVIVGDIATTEYDWPWCTKIYSSHYTHHNLAYIGNNGSIGLLKLDIDCLASAGGDDFVACSLDGTSIKILNNESVEISTVNINTHIHAIDLNDNTLVVVCKDRISIYSLVTDEKLKRLNVVPESDISLESSASFCKIVDGHNIVAIAFHTKISMYSINDGRKLRTWKVPCAITSISNYPGGCSGIGEILLLLACQDGWIFSLSLYTSSIDKILKVEKEAKIMARSRQNLIGIIDKDKQLLVYDIKDKCTRHQGELATDIVFHNQLESLYCYYTSEGSLKVRDGDAQASITPKCQGQIVKFTGCLIYLMDDGKLSTYKVNLAPIVKQKIQMKQFDRALSIARLGVESKIWEMIAHTALKNLNFDIFKECYIFLGKDYSEMSMIKRLKKDFEEFDSGNITKDHLQCLVTAEIDIVDGCIERAGEMFISLGCNERAIDLFLTQNMFHKAKLVPKQTTVQRNFILMSEAKWEEEFNNNYIRASELYAECGCFLKSVHAANKIEGDERVDRVCYISKLIPTTEIDALTQCYHYIQNDPRYFDDLKDILLKIEDYTLLISLYITRKSWIDVGTIWKDYKQKIVDKTIIFPYSDWLAGNGNIADALKVNREAGQNRRNRNLLSFLINDAIVQESYYELSKLLWQAALEARHSHDYSVSFIMQIQYWCQF
jgi:intraflagellar transport protein 122